MSRVATDYSIPRYINTAGQLTTSILVRSSSTTSSQNSIINAEDNVVIVLLYVVQHHHLYKKKLYMLVQFVMANTKILECYHVRIHIV